MYNLFSRNISKSNCSIASISHIYNALSLKSPFNMKRSLLESITNIIKSIQENIAEATVKKVMLKDFLQFGMNNYGCQIMTRSLLFIPSRDVLQIMFSSTSSKHFYLSTNNQRKMDSNTFVVYNKILHDFLKSNFEKKRIGELYNGPGYITKFCQSLQNSNLAEQHLEMWKSTNKDLTESLNHLQKDRKQSIKINQQSQKPKIYAQLAEKKSDSGMVQKLENYPQEDAVLSKSSIPIMMKQLELSQHITVTVCHENNYFPLNILDPQKLNLSRIKAPTFTVTKRYLKKSDKDPKRNKIPSQICKGVKPKKKFSNEKKIPAQECKDKIASKKAKRDASTFLRSMTTGRLATPEIKTNKLKIIVSRYKFTTKNKSRKSTEKVGASKQISIPKTPNSPQNMTHKNKLESLVEPAKQYIEMLKVAGEIKIKNIKDQITQNLNELKNNPKEFLKSILLEQPEKEINDEKSKTVNLEKQESKLTTVTDQLKVESKKLNNSTFLKIPPVDKKPLIEKMKDSLETSIETDFKQTFGNSFKESKSKITLKALENLTKTEAAIKLLTIDKSNKQYLFENEERNRKEDNYLLQGGKDDNIQKQKGVNDERSTATEEFFKKNWLLSKDNYCGEIVKKSGFPLSTKMDERSGDTVQEKSEMLFKNMSKITRLIQLETKKNDWLSEVEFFSSPDNKDSPFDKRKSEKSEIKGKTFLKNRSKPEREDNLSPDSLLDKEEKSVSSKNISKSNTKQEGMSKELIKKISEDDKSIKNTGLLARVRNKDNSLQINEDTALIGKRKPERFERPFITPSHVPPPKKEEEKKKKFPPPSRKGRMILPPRNVSDTPKLANTDMSKNISETELSNIIKDDVVAKNNDVKELQHDSKIKDNILPDKKITDQKFKDNMSNNEDVKEFKQQPKEIIIEKKSKVEIVKHLPRKAKDKLVCSKDSDFKKLITLEDKEHLRHNLRYILTLIEELDIEYKDGSDENLIKQSQEMDKIDKKPPKKLGEKTEAKLNTSVSKVAGKPNDLTKLEKNVHEKLSPTKVSTKEQDFPDRKIQENADERLDSSIENTKAKLSTISKTLETPQDNINVKYSHLQQNKHFDTASKENEYNKYNQNKSELDRKNEASSLMDYYRLDEDTTPNEPPIQTPMSEEKTPESSLMHFYLLDEDDRIAEKSISDPKTSNFPKKSEFQRTKETKQGVSLEKPKNNVAFTKTKNIKTSLPGEINKEGFKTNTFNIKEYQGVKETKQGILIEKQKKKVKNNTFKKLITSKGVFKTNGDSIPENEQKNKSSKNIKPTSTTRSLTSISKNKITYPQQKDLEKGFEEFKTDEMRLRNVRTQPELLTKENNLDEAKYSCNLPETEKMLSYNHGVKLIFGGCHEQHTKDKIKEDEVSVLATGCWKLHKDIDGNRKYLFTQSKSFEEKTIIDTTLTSDKDDNIPPTKIETNKDKDKQLKKKEHVSKEKETTNDQTLKMTHKRKKRMKAPITIKEDPNKTPLVTVIYSKKRQVEKTNKGAKASKREKVVYKVNKKRTGSSTRDKARSRKRRKPKRRNIILFLLKDEIKRNEDWQAQIMDRYMSPNERVEQALNKYKFNTPTEVSNDFNTIPSADLEMNQRKRTKERLADSFYKKLQKTLFNSRRVPKSKSDVKSEKEKEISEKEKDNHETNSMLADNNSKSASNYETKHNCDKLSKTDNTNITNNGNDSTLEPKSMHECVSPINIILEIK